MAWFAMVLALAPLLAPVLHAHRPALPAQDCAGACDDRQAPPRHDADHCTVCQAALQSVATLSFHPVVPTPLIAIAESDPIPDFPHTEPLNLFGLGARGPPAS